MKLFEFFLQTAFLVLSLISLAVNDYSFINPIYPIAGFAILQIISIIAHLVIGKKEWKMAKWRKIHHIGTLLVFLLLFIALVQDSSGRSGDKDDKYNMNGLGTLIFALIPSILLALFYFIITWKEWKNSKKLQPSL